MTPKEFQKRMGTLAKNIKVNVPKVVQKAALVVDQTLVTGASRNRRPLHPDSLVFKVAGHLPK
jgi:hypothetical protein